ncbi:MAG: MarR family transcriptional regulator [Clostridia bacterium]|nr:MarR family transcriptional regulator [Clostridia bacterium]
MLDRYEMFSAAIATIYHQIQKLERDEMVRFGSKGIFAQYLAALKAHPEGMTSSQLSEVLDKDKAAVSRALGDMSASGLVTRQGKGVYRARMVLTQKGREAAEYVSQRACAAVTAVSEGVTDEERRAMYRALEVIAHNLELINREGIPE